MKKYLFPQNVNFYKANLHCHTNISDGRKMPEQIKEMYKQKGYSIVCYTDHNIMLPHDYLNDENFLTLHGMELDVEEDKEGAFAFKKACHICVIALEPDNLKHICCNKNIRYIGNGANYLDKIEFDERDTNFKREYTKECINYMIMQGRENGFFVTYNHPAWNTEGYEDYMSYEGMHAMEIMNWGCHVADFSDEYCEHQYDDLLRGGNRIFCIGSDDNHNKYDDSFGAYTVIMAEKLDYKTVTKALLDGHFYASQGPEIYNLWFEDDKLFVECSDASCIRFSTDSRRAKNFFPENEGEFLNKAEFPMYEPDKYVRITITDKNGKKAFTNAYFTDTFFEKNK